MHNILVGEYIIRHSVLTEKLEDVLKDDESSSREIGKYAVKELSLFMDLQMAWDRLYDKLNEKNKKESFVQDLFTRTF